MIKVVYYKAGSQECKDNIVNVVVEFSNVSSINCSWSDIGCYLDKLTFLPDAVVVENIESWEPSDVSRLLDQLSSSDVGVLVLIATNDFEAISKLRNLLPYIDFVDGMSTKIEYVIEEVKRFKVDRSNETKEIDKIIGDFYA